MSLEKSRKFELDGTTYEVRRMTPVVGSYIWQVMMRAAVRASKDMGGGSVQGQEGALEQATAEEKTRGLATLALMNMDFREHEFVQNAVMRLMLRHENGAPMPFMVDDSRWDSRIYEEIGSNPALVTKLVIEGLVFNLSGFFQ